MKVRTPRINRLALEHTHFGQNDKKCPNWCEYTANFERVLLSLFTNTKGIKEFISEYCEYIVILLLKIAKIQSNEIRCDSRCLAWIVIYLLDGRLAMPQ